MPTLFDSLVSIDSINTLIASGIRESEVLEYKTASGPFSDSNKSEIAKDVSAMANSLGGTIIYGVATKKDDKTLPEVVVPIDVKNIETLDRVINAQIRPPIVGLKKKLIPDHSPQLLILEIPESDNPPHQNLYDKKYYRRSGSESLPMEHDLVALKFGRKSSPIVELIVKPLSTPRLQQGTPSPAGEGIVRVFVTNQGRRVARHVQYLLLFPSVDDVFVSGRSGTTQQVNQLYPPRQAQQFQNDSGVYHPGTSTSTAEIGIALSEKFMRDHHADPLIEWRLWADEMSERSGTITLADLGWTASTHTSTGG